MDINEITYPEIKDKLCEECKKNNKNTYRLMILCEDCNKKIYSENERKIHVDGYGNISINKIDSISLDTKPVHKIESIVHYAPWREIDD